jgi:excisionase family DNA binding protein
MATVSKAKSSDIVTEFYTVKQLANALQITEMTVYRLVRRGELPCHSIGRAMRFRRSDVEGFLRKCREASREGRARA